MDDDYDMLPQGRSIRRFPDNDDELLGRIEVYASGRIPGAIKLHGKFVTMMCRGANGVTYCTKKVRRQKQVGTWIKVVQAHVMRDKIYCNERENEIHFSL